MSATSTAMAMGGLMAAGIVENPLDPATWKDSKSKNTHSPSNTMSASPEVHHGAEAAHGSESAIETLSDGIKKIMQSVVIAVKKVFNGVTGFFKETVGSLFKSNSHGADHGSAHAAPAAAAAAAAHH